MCGSRHSLTLKLCAYSFHFLKACLLKHRHDVGSLLYCLLQVSLQSSEMNGHLRPYHIYAYNKQSSNQQVLTHNNMYQDKVLSFHITRNCFPSKNCQYINKYIQMLGGWKIMLLNSTYRYHHCSWTY